MEAKLRIAIKERRIGQKKYKEINPEGFSSLSEFERIQVIHEYPLLVKKKYEELTRVMLDDLWDGLLRASAFDGAKPSNHSSISDVTGNTAVKKVSISSNNVEDVFGYGEDEAIDQIIDLERALKIYYQVIKNYETGMASVLVKRFEGKSLRDIEDETHYSIDTISHYIYIAKKLLDDKFEEVMKIMKARESIAKKRDEQK